MSQSISQVIFPEITQNRAVPLVVRPVGRILGIFISKIGTAAESDVTFKLFSHPAAIKASDGGAWDEADDGPAPVVPTDIKYATLAAAHPGLFQVGEEFTIKAGEVMALSSLKLPYICTTTHNSYSSNDLPLYLQFSQVNKTAKWAVRLIVSIDV